MKKYRNIIIALSATLFIGAAIMAMNSVGSYAVTDYDGNGIITQDEKQKYYKEVYGVDPYTEGWDAFNAAIDELVEKHGTPSGSSQSNSPTPTQKSEGTAHTHSYTATVTKDATCTEAGEMTYKCSCGDTYTEVIAMKPHDYESNVTKEPTCTETGTQTQVCKNCGDTIETVIPALGHKPGDWVTEKEPTCSEEGRNVRYCTVCGEPVETMIIDKLPHTEGEWEITQKPTLTKAGLKVVKCTECGEVLKEETIPANTTLFYILIGAGVMALIGVIVGIIAYKRRR